MKKCYYTLLFCFTVLNLNAQSSWTLEWNGTKAIGTHPGFLFNDHGINAAGYEIPKGSDRNVLYELSPVFSAILDTVGGTMEVVSQRQEWALGPLSNDYNSSDYQQSYQSHNGVVVTESMINQHIQNHQNVGYVMPDGIQNWPANGNSILGVGNDLAPYSDHNQNGVYDPENGDYPLIKGEAATYIIWNDENNPSNSSYKLRVEVHFMIYQFASNHDFVNNSTFVSCRIINRSTVSYSDFRAGFFSDFDLGGPHDDYAGTDSSRNLFYVYNADNLDEDASGTLGYSTNPPAFGIQVLNDSLSSALVIGNQFISSGDLALGRLLRGIQPDGTMVLDPQSTPTKFSFYSNPNDLSGWSMATAGLPPVDIKGVMALYPRDLNAGEELCFDLALVYASDSTLNSSEIVDDLEYNADELQDFFDSLNY